MFDFINPSLVAILIPIIVVIGVFAVVITSIIVQGKHKELEHQQRLIAMEKGIPIPETQPKAEKRKRPAHLKFRVWGLVLLFLGIAIVIGIWLAAGAVGGVWGLVPASIGAALLVASRLEQRDSDLMQ